jgi:hypothetical protein
LAVVPLIRSAGATRSYAAIRVEVEQMLAEAAEADADEDKRLGDARGDELPAELPDTRSRRERMRRCKQELERAQADEEPAIGPTWPGEPPGRPSTGVAWRVGNRLGLIRRRSRRGRSTRPTPTRG